MPTVLSKLTFGGDPEFLVEEITTGSFVGAEGVLRHPNLHSMIGVDGCSYTGEIRIPPQTSFLGIFKAMKDIICVKLPQELNLQRYRITAGSGKSSPTGGHIHFGGMGKSASSAFLKNIAFFITRPLNEVSNTQRRAGSYGNENDYEGKGWGGFEARSPLSWIISPKITKGVYAIAEVLAKHGKETIIGDWVSLIGLSTPQEKRAIESYRKELKWFKEKERKLEEVDVYKAWISKGKHISYALSHMKQGFFLIQYSIRDFNMGEIFNNSNHKIPQCRIKIYFTGKKQATDSDKAIYIPTIFDELLINLPKKINGILIKKWSHPHFGLTYSLRENPVECRNAVVQIIYHLNTAVKKRPAGSPPIPFI